MCKCDLISLIINLVSAIATTCSVIAAIWTAIHLDEFKIKRSKNLLKKRILRMVYEESSSPNRNSIINLKISKDFEVDLVRELELQRLFYQAIITYKDERPYEVNCYINEASYAPFVKINNDKMEYYMKLHKKYAAWYELTNWKIFSEDVVAKKSNSFESKLMKKLIRNCMRGKFEM